LEAFLWSEWNEVVDAWQLRTAGAYRSVARLGRKTRLSEKQRDALWKIFERVETALADAGKVTMPQVFEFATEAMKGSSGRPFDFVVVDEAQDVSVSQLRFFAALAGGMANGLLFTGDLGQRIFQSPFSWKSLGIDVRGRSHTLRINYRTSQQIRQKPIGCCQDGDRRRWNRLRPRSHPVGVQRSASSSHDRQNSGSRDSSGRRLDSDVQIVGDWTR
jgi:hypothetical protein